MFELTKAQKQIQQAAESFAKGEFDKRLAYEFDKTGEFPADIHKMAAELGFVGIHFPEKYAGGGLGLLEAVLVSQAFCRRDASIGAALALASFGAECLLRFGSDHLKQTFLPKVAEGEMLSAGAFSESQRGGNYAAIKATAETKNRHWIVNGVKTNVINGGSAGFYIVLCRTQPEQANPGEGISMILVEGDRPGIASRTVGRKLGGNLSATAQVTFEAVAVPRDNLLGREGQGILQLKRFVAENGILSAARALGTAMGSFDRAMDYVKQREQFQRKLAAFQVTRHKIADMATKIELAQLITHKAAWARDNGRPEHPLAAMAKMTAARTAMQVGAQAIQLYGGYGYMTEYEVERYYREAKMVELHMGAGDAQRDVIADTVIGKLKK